MGRALTYYRILCGFGACGAQAFVVLLPLLLSPKASLAQVTTTIVPDGTAGSMKSLSGSTTEITGGTLRGGNLFHSFSRFDIGNGDTARFIPDSGVKNIFTRVTGGDASNINGVLGVSTNSNLFFINPKGIFLGSDAKIDLSGSFTATTANAVQLNNGQVFSASIPQNASLLQNDVTSPVGFQFSSIPQSINVQGQIKSQNSINLVGGRAKFEGANLSTDGGAVSILALAQPGSIDFNLDENTLVYKEFKLDSMNDVIVDQGSKISSDGLVGGSIEVYGRNIVVSDDSGIESITRGSEDGKPLYFSASESLEITGKKDGDETYIFATTTGSGKGGDFLLEAKDVRIVEGGFISTTTNGTGDAGNLTLNASGLVSLEGAVLTSTKANRESGLYAGTVGDQISGTLDGNGGVITVTAKELSITDGAQIAANNDAIVSVKSSGAAGSISIDVQDTVSIVGTASIESNVKHRDGSSQPSAISSFTVNSQDAGELTINAGSLSITDGASVSATTNWIGNGGDINITVDDTLEVSGKSREGKGSRLRSATLQWINSELDRFDAGNGGDLSIHTDKLIVRDGGRIDSRTNTTGDGIDTTGNAGNINIKAASLVELSGGGQIISTTSGRGRGGTGSNTSQAGNITVEGISETIEGSSQTIERNPDIIISGLDLQFDTDKKRLENIGIFGETIFSEISVSGTDVTLSEIDSEVASSGIVTRAKANSIGEGGNIKIHANSIFLEDGAQLSSGTEGDARAGDITVTAEDIITLDGEGAFNQALIPSGIFTETKNSGNGGNISLQSKKFVASNGALLNSETKLSGEGGNIDVNVNDFLAESRSQLRTTTSGSQKAGTITINSEDSIEITGDGTNILANTKEGSTGVGGDIELVSNTIDLDNSALVSVRSDGNGIGGNISTKSKVIQLDNESSIEATTASADGGNITFDVENLLFLRNMSSISATAGDADQQPGTGGNITINAPEGFVIAVPKENSDITANAFQGQGGFIDITTQRVFGLEQRTANTRLSDVTAISARSPEFNGTTQINNVGIDPTGSLNSLPEEPRRTEVAEGCQVTEDEEEAAKFFNIGNGGIPPRPEDPLSSSISMPEWTDLDEEVAFSDSELQSPVELTAQATESSKEEQLESPLRPPCDK